MAERAGIIPKIYQAKNNPFAVANYLDKNHPNNLLSTLEEIIMC